MNTPRKMCRSFLGKILLILLCLAAAEGGTPAFGVAAEDSGDGAASATRSAQTSGQPSLHEFLRSDYGEYLGELGGGAIWWCQADWKVSRDRVPPAKKDGPAGIRLACAKGDVESCQLVISPQQEMKLLQVSLSDLRNAQGAVIRSENAQVYRVHYHYVHTPTDATGLQDWWPDALPPLEGPIVLAAKKNQPLWVNVKVPRDAAAGDYLAEITLVGDGWQATVPLEIHVWDFALPERNHLETALGFDPWLMFRYHGASTEQDRRQLLDLYFRCFAEHRISPYDPTPLDPIKVEFQPKATPPRADVDFSRFDPAMEQAVAKYHFTNFMLRIQGMGGGTFHSRVEPSIAGYGENTPEYKAMFASQVQQIESHLRDKGWLSMAYVYWFDEPDPKDYEFVKAGMLRLKTNGPGLARMLTEEPVEPLFGLVDIWCPVTPNYNHEIAEARRKAGERFWWYVCTGPKAPYCTLFIDHPATELRVWLWQTWQRRISGILVWQTNYWTSSAAFPDDYQDPYEDPMGYVSGYSTPKGVKRFWGNGDGRFIYPPISASKPGKQPTAVIAPPASSIRWEMLREGVEDYEMLWMLADLIQRCGDRLSPDDRSAISKLLEVPPEITRDMTTFTKVPQPIYEHRARVAEAIETLVHLDVSGK